MNLLPRSDLKGKYPRCHYNKLGKAKQAFYSEKSTQKYLRKMSLMGYTVYQCRYCNQYHIAH